MLFLLLACGSTDPSEHLCTDGELRLASDGMTYDTLFDALAHAASSDRVCVGAGTFDIGTRCEEGLELGEMAQASRSTGMAPSTT